MKPGFWIIGLGGAAAVGIWLLFVELPRRYPAEPVAAGDRAAAMPAEGDTVEATLFYISDDGMGLVGVERRLERHAAPAAQARRILEAQLAKPAPPLLTPIPVGTRLRAVYLTERGEAFVDLSAEVTRAHSGGSLEELFTVYAIVNALTTNLPAITAVQILVNGEEVDTLAGHVDLRRPLEQNMQWVADPEEDDATDLAPVEPAT